MKKQDNIHKNNSISLSRVTGMFFIVLCHIIGFYNFIPGHEILGQFLNCGVSLFLFISGYLYGNKHIENFKKWYAKRLLKISAPAIIISVIVITVLIIMGQNVSVPSVFAYLFNLEGLLFLNYSFANVFSEIPSLGPLWFTTIIMLCYLLVPMLEKILAKINQKTYHISLVLLTIVGFTISCFISHYFVLSYFVIFSIGYFIGNKHLLENVNAFFLIFYSCLSVFVAVGRIVLHQYFDGTQLYSSFVTICQFIVGTWFIVFFFFLNKKIPKVIDRAANSKVMTILDKYSYYIYLVHGIFCIGTLNVFSVFSILPATFIFLFATIISAILLKFITSKITAPLLRKL